MSSRHKVFVVFALALALPLTTLAGKASFGFSVKLDTSGFVINPTVEQVSIAHVVPDSPAQQAGLQVGDVVLTANDRPIKGTKARALGALMDGLSPGDRLRLEVSRPDGTVTAVEMVGGVRPGT